jgi:Domain of unknown function (DUF4124)
MRMNNCHNRRAIGEVAVRALRWIAFGSFVFLAAYGPEPSAQMYKCQTKEGRTIYQEHPCPTDAKAAAIRKPAQSQDGGAAASSAGGAKRKPEEDKALGNLIVIASVQKDCQRLVGRYVSLDEMRKGCVGQGMSMGLHKDNDPNGDANYDYRLSVSASRFELSVSPRRSGLTGYFTDGQNLYENPSGPASRQNQLMGPLPYF